jgi:hypothetical protein
MRGPDVRALRPPSECLQKVPGVTGGEEEGNRDYFLSSTRRCRKKSVAVPSDRLDERASRSFCNHVPQEEAK